MEALLTRRALAPDLVPDDASALLAHTQRLVHAAHHGTHPPPLPAKAASLVTALPTYEDSLRALRRVAHAEFLRVQSRKRAREDVSDARAHARLDAHTTHTMLRALESDAHARAETLETRAEAALTRAAPAPLQSLQQHAGAPVAPAASSATVNTSYAPLEPRLARMSAEQQRLPQPLPASATAPSTPQDAAKLEERRRGAGGFDAALAATRARAEAWDALGLRLA